MAEPQFTDEYEAPEADAVEQLLPADPEAEVDGDPQRDELPELTELPLEADPADAVEQAVVVPVDEDEYR
jgi:hypothetical protein